MDSGRTLLSCPGRVQDWLGAAADQVETLLRVPMPSLSGSDEAIGALRIKQEKSSRTTCAYDLRVTDEVSGAFHMCHLSPSVSSDRPLCAEKSPSRCENCVAEKGSRCSRDLPSCTRCHKNGMVCFYTQGVPTGRRKPQGRRRERSRIKEGESGLLVEDFLIAPASEDPTLLQIDEALAARCHRPELSSLCTVSKVARPSLEHLTAYLVGLSTEVSFSEKSTNPLCQTIAAKRHVTMLPALRTLNILPQGTNTLEDAPEVVGAESHPGLSNSVANALDSSLV